MCPTGKSDGAGRQWGAIGLGLVFVMLVLAALRADSESCRRRPSAITCSCTPLPQLYRRYLLHWTPDTSETVANPLNTSDAE
ncbi:hypothetical protein PMIN01_08355 [Paraphaeosphaeria minitans]|uniref:Uncharacterized protein n=1 Tax=Paraphaeosphaeria minitans TaxID=565426 RepID=A0A9P6GDZ9_9PLEO|nr:hypothetical protein PMIN01_08355 [Paraphaeosphaeria minitans]